MLVTTALLVVVLAVLTTFLPLGGKHWNVSAARAEALQHGRIALDELRYELNYAYRVETDPLNSRLTYYKKEEEELRRYRVYLSGRQLLLALPEGTSVPLASCIDRFDLSPGGILLRGDTLTVTLTLSDVGQSVKLRSAVTPKNLTEEGL